MTSFLLLLIFSLFALPSLAFSQSPCHLLTASHSVPSGYGAAYDTLSSTQELLLRATCSDSGATLKVGNGSNLQYIYEQGYEWRDNQWQAFSYSGSNKNGPWIIGEGSATRSRTSAEMSQPSFFVAYVCTWTGQATGWKCGCRDSICTQPSWQLQAFHRAPSGSQGSNGAATPRDEFWTGEGYELFWHSTPSANDIGRDPMTFFRSGEWTNGQPLNPEVTSFACRPGLGSCGSANVTIEDAPDGSPSVKAFIPKGKSGTVMSIRGMQFGLRGPEKDVVFSLEWYNPCRNGVTPNHSSGAYIGFGHHWGAADNVTHAPGGSTNYDDAWTLRVPMTSRNEFTIYAYIPDKSTAHGRTFVPEPRVFPECDAWNSIELEVIQNDPPSAKNAVLRLYLDGTLVDEFTGTQTRTKATVRPRGFGMYVKHNSGAPQDENLYWRNWKMYVR